MKQKKEKKTPTEYYLTGIHSPADLRALPPSAMPRLCEEIREFLIENVTQKGGHLASNLGVVELSVALHRVFDAPTDHIIFDVGHQCYVHKLLTGRREGFAHLREVGGLSGFTNRRESEYDAFGAGHSSTSVSAALGFATADRIAGKNAYTVAVIGDGAFTGGMVHEALNNCPRDLPLIIMLNENEMSISRNTGAFARYIASLRTTRAYLKTKRGTAALLSRLPLIGRPLHRALRRLRSGLKRSITKNNYFEALGLLYLGPIDGNDYQKVERTLRAARARRAPVVVHLKTEKGRGYEPAAENPSRYHNMSPAAAEKSETTFHGVFGDTLCEMAKADQRITAITAAMGIGCGLEGFSAAYPDRFFDVGIAEEHAVTFAAGMAAEGLIPCFAVYSTFLQRAYDNVLHDVALQNLPVKLFIDRTGLAVHDGATHHGIFDVSFLSAIPNMQIFSPACYGSLRAIMRHVMALPAPCAVRYPNAGEDARVAEVFYPKGDFHNFGLRADFKAGEQKRNLIVTYGTTVSRTLDAKAEAEAAGGSVGILLLETLKPYGAVADTLLPYLAGDARVIFLEEGIEHGGASECLLAALRERGATPKDYRILAIHDHFAAPTAPCDLYRHCGIGKEDILAAMKN